MTSSSKLCHRFFVLEVLFAAPAGVTAMLGSVVLAAYSLLFLIGSTSQDGWAGTVVFFGIMVGAAGGLLVLCTLKALSRFVRLSVKYFDRPTGNMLEKSADRGVFLRGVAWAIFPIVVACGLSLLSGASMGMPAVLIAIYLTGLPILIPVIHLWIKINRARTQDITAIF